MQSEDASVCAGDSMHEYALTTERGADAEIGWGPRAHRRLTLEMIQFSIAAFDVAIVLIGYVLARVLWTDSVGWGGVISGDVMSVGALEGIVFAGFLGLRRAYSVTCLSNPTLQARLVIQGWAFTFFIVGWLAFLTKASSDFSRGATLLQFVFGFLGVAGFHVFGARWLGRRFACAEISLRRVALIAMAESSALDRIRGRLAQRGIEVVRTSLISPSDRAEGEVAPQYRAALADVREALAAAKLDEVYLFASWRDRRQVDELRISLGSLPVPIYLFADREIEALLAGPQVQIGPLRGFEVQRAPLGRVDRMVKRGLDLLVASVAIVVLAPLMGLTALAILFETGRPVLFRQTRKGFGARPFDILKFRSMTVQENGPTVPQATRRDPRVTPLGRILRKTSVDELPQLFNVLRGDMSIVGPRPHAVAHDDEYDALIATYAVRQHVKPGITGWAQVSGHRGETRELGQMSARVEHDLWYIDHWSLWLDIKIIALTAIRILNDDRAY